MTQAARVCTLMSVNMSMHTCTCFYTWRICTHGRINVCMSAFMRVYINICAHICMHAYAHVYPHVQVDAQVDACVLSL